MALVLSTFAFTVPVSAQYGYNNGGGTSGGTTTGSTTGSSSSWGWGWGWSSSLQRDYCPDGDFSASYYDGNCDVWVAAGVAPTGTTTTSTTSTTTSPTLGTITTPTGTTSVITTTSTTPGTVGTIAGTTTTIVAPAPQPVVAEEEVEMVKSIKDILSGRNPTGGSSVNSQAAGNSQLVAPAFLPQTWASL